MNIQNHAINIMWLVLCKVRLNGQLLSQSNTILCVRNQKYNFILFQDDSAWCPRGAVCRQTGTVCRGWVLEQYIIMPPVICHNHNEGPICFSCLRDIFIMGHIWVLHAILFQTVGRTLNIILQRLTIMYLINILWYRY